MCFAKKKEKNKLKYKYRREKNREIAIRDDSSDPSKTVNLIKSIRISL